MNSTQAFYIHGLRLRYIHGRTTHLPLNHTAFAVGYRGGIVCFLLKQRASAESSQFRQNTGRPSYPAQVNLLSLGF
jgi:hypothetical protein